jgi:hypothetical protein
MTTDTFILGGRAYSWRQLRAMRQAQLEERRKARGTQPALFELHDDCRPAHERTAANRYAAPSLFEAMRDIPP